MGSQDRGERATEEKTLIATIVEAAVCLVELNYFHVREAVEHFYELPGIKKFGFGQLQRHIPVRKSFLVSALVF